MEIRITGPSIMLDLLPFLGDPLKVVFNFLLMAKIEGNSAIHVLQR